MTDTRTSTLPPTPPGTPAARSETAAEAAARVGLALPGHKHRWWAWPVAALSVVFLLLVAMSGVLPAQLVASKTSPAGETIGTPYARTPASALPVDERLVFGDLGDAAEQFPPTGDIFFVTVTEPPQSVLSWYTGRDDPAVQFLTELEKFGVQTPQERRQVALESMRTSEQEAQFVALRRVGYDVEMMPGDVLVREMVCLEANEDGSECVRWSPSDDVLDPGDRILEADGQPIEGVEDLGQVLAKFAPGDVITMVVDRPDEGELTLDVELTVSPTEPDRTIVGFIPSDTREVVLPFELDIDTGSIGGPSAGLAFTLTLIDELTEGELTGGRDIAVTGTIQLDGTVGPIGGLRQKASAVAQRGVEVFLVPGLPEGSGPEREAAFDADIAAAKASGGPDLEIVPVRTLEEAIDALAARGGTPIPSAEELAAARNSS